MKLTPIWLLVFFLASTAHAQGLTGADVSFMDFATVDPAAVCARIATSDPESISNLRRFASFEALHNARGGADKARQILECLATSAPMSLDASADWGSAASSIRVPAAKPVAVAKKAAVRAKATAKGTRSAAGK